MSRKEELLLLLKFLIEQLHGNIPSRTFEMEEKDILKFEKTLKSGSDIILSYIEELKTL